ncbi:hypothetical protein [Haemophilus influenzae]|uniref:hypothetical protein n=1 Tax=Haemophilus influenzae TaxID=727 RepID=UPI000D00AE48|nr:hypothetical protein [Haemophilus influenzae]PRJ56385.1 hypothetical protein BV097_00044 [Haemophilus influenzae]PRJ57407.1 hypothetical protein BV094_00536 [Haemophilus influenzae]PRM19461.1 hypothetical protein BV011_00379 [Haemophilus influenzae]
MMQQEQPLTVESLKRILSDYDERLSRLENATLAQDLNEIWTARQVAEYAKISYGYFMQTLSLDPNFPASVGTLKKHAPKKYRAAEVIEFFKNRNKA